jgi:hypothetical protein
VRRHLVLAALAVSILAALAYAKGDSADATLPVATPAESASASSATEEPASTSILPEAPPEAPPPPPFHKGFVLESRLGGMAFLGQFRHVAPPAPWIYTQFGYEPLKWLMFFVYGELAFTDTSEASPPPQARAFPFFGFGGGLRFTLHFTERVAAFLQGNIGGMKADVPNGALIDLGYRDAEGLNPAFGARLGLEWYQVDRHMALGLGGGIRDAKGFAKTIGGDTPLMLDVSLALRYTF